MDTSAKIGLIFCLLFWGFMLWWVFLIIERLIEKISHWRKNRKKDPTASPWFLPAGIIAIFVGIISFLASAAVGGNNFFNCLLSGLLNPLFFIGLPLGVYWLYRFARSYRPLPHSRRRGPGGPGTKT